VVKGRDTGTNKLFYGVLAAVAVAGLAVIGWYATRPAPAPRQLAGPVSPELAEGYLYGDPNAPVQISEFADFQCPACAHFATITVPDVKRRIVDAGLASYRFYDFPLNQHANAIPAAMAAACAADQGRFWEMHDAIFAGQTQWSDRRNPKGTFEGYASRAGVNVGEWERCYDEQRHLERITANQQYGLRMGVGSTPTIIVGRHVLPGAISYDRVRAYVDSAAADAAAAGVPTAQPAGTAP
jgi:protein-disulfide isomerase